MEIYWKSEAERADDRCFSKRFPKKRLDLEIYWKSGWESAFREEVHLNAHLFDVLGEQSANEGLGKCFSRRNSPEHSPVLNLR